MFRKIWCLAVLSLLVFTPVISYASIADVVDDYDDAASDMTATRWSGEWGGGDAYQTGSTVTAKALGNMGKSYWLNWGNVDAAGEGVGCGLQGLGGIDISTYNALSFWIWSRDTAEGLTIELVDSGDDNARVALTDYLTTGASTWQEVSIPLIDFQRDDNTMDLTSVAKINFVSDYDSGDSDTQGNIYLDDITLTVQYNAPADANINSGGDYGAANSADMKGDTLLWWDQATSTIASNEVAVTVQDGYSLIWASQPSDGNGSANSIAYFPYQILNNGNDADTIVFSTALVTGENWSASVYWDRNGNGSFDAGVDTTSWSSVGALAGTTYYFLVGVDIPVSAVDGSSATIQVTARDNNGSGSNDSWPTGANDDTITDSFQVTVQGTNCTLVKSRSTATGKPGDTVTYTLVYGNSGSIEATGTQIIDTVPENTFLSGASSAGDMDSVEYYVGSSWQGGYDATATKIRWLRASLLGGATGQVTFDVEIK